MLGKIICFFFGHRIDRLPAFKDRPIFQVIDPNIKKKMVVDACLRCGTVTNNVEKGEQR